MQCRPWRGRWWWWDRRWWRGDWRWRSGRTLRQMLYVWTAPWTAVLHSARRRPLLEGLLKNGRLENATTWIYCRVPHSSFLCLGGSFVAPGLVVGRPNPYAQARGRERFTPYSSNWLVHADGNCEV